MPLYPSYSILKGHFDLTDFNIRLLRVSKFNRLISEKEKVQKMVEKQREDMPYRVMMDYCDSGKIPDDELEREVIRTTDKYVTIEGVLYKINEAGSKDSHEMDLLLCVPHSLRSTLIKLYHVAMGHCSDEICIASLRTRYYWPKLATEVKQVLKGCLACEKYKDVKPARARAYETQLVMESASEIVRVEGCSIAAPVLVKNSEQAH